MSLVSCVVDGTVRHFPKLRRVLAKRAGILAPTPTENDRDFLDRLAEAGALAVYEVDPSEWSFNP